MAVRNFYIYNECFKEVVSRVQYAPFGSATAIRNRILVAPGEHVLIATEGLDLTNMDDPTPNEGSIVASAVSTDGSLSWSERAIRSSSVDYTHVLACKCDEGADCRLPKPWPEGGPDGSRQDPDHP